MANPVIRIENLKKSYGDVEAVKGVSLEINEGELFGLIGPNGAGKTTLFRMLLGLTTPSSGRIDVRGVDLSSAWNREVKANTGYLPENIMFYDHLTGMETLSFYAKLKKVDRSELPKLLELVGLADAAHREVYGYSKGMKQRLGLAQALLGSPKILFLDEPTNGLDPEGIAAFYNILKDVKSRGTTIILTSHILKEIQDRVDRLGIIGGGRLIASGSVSELRSELGLQPTMHLAVDGDMSVVENTVISKGGELIESRPGHISLRCLNGDKMKLFRALSVMEGVVTDIELTEPSLDDVFFGYASREAV